MKKRLFIATVFAATMFAACTNDYTESIPDVGVKTVTLNLGGDFTIEQMTRSTSLDMAQDIFVLDFMDGNIVQTIHKTKGDGDFAKPAISLKYGKHDLYVVVSEGKEPKHIPTTNTIIWETIGDTFRGYSAVEISTKSANTLNVTLDRVVAMLSIKSTDQIPGDAQSVSITLAKWYYGINYVSGSPAGLVTNYTVTVNDLSKDSYFNADVFEFATNEETKMDVTLNASVAYSSIKHTIQSVPLKANTVTQLKGNIFTTSSTSSGGESYSTPETFGVNIKLNNSWGTGYNMTW